MQALAPSLAKLAQLRTLDLQCEWRVLGALCVCGCVCVCVCVPPLCCVGDALSSVCSDCVVCVAVVWL